MTGDILIASAAPESVNIPPARLSHSMEAGAQPLDRLMEELGLANHALVASSGEHLTHKEVQKARRGRRLTARLQGKIARALGAAAGKPFRVEELFNYAGR